MTETTDQTETIAFMEHPATHGGAAVERIDTHSAIVFLAGARAWKLKRALKFPFLDFSTLARRAECCRREIELNKRTAPTLYRKAVPVTRTADGGLALDGAGAPVDWLVSMNRFEQSGLFDRMAAAGSLTPDLMTALADTIAAFHRGAEVTPDKGGAEAMRWVIDDNIEELRAFGDLFDAAALDTLDEGSHALLDANAPRLDARRADGRVRHCHGDLHLQNICLVEGHPTLFDCIEFNDDIACVDVVYDLAFLLMDLAHRGRRDLANLVLNRYLARTGDWGGLAILELFLSCRAAVKAKVLAISGRSDPSRIPEAKNFLAQAVSYLERPAPRLVTVGGAPGTGKSTLAQRIAPEIGGGCGAILLRTDVLRKQMLGTDILERLPEDAYDRETTARTYDRVLDEAEALLRAGISVIADATFTDARFRQRIEDLARQEGVPFAGIWLQAPQALREERIEGRTNDPSDATVGLIRRFTQEPAAPEGWLRLDSSQPLDRMASNTLREILT